MLWRKQNRATGLKVTGSERVATVGIQEEGGDMDTDDGGAGNGEK